MGGQRDADLVGRLCVACCAFLIVVVLLAQSVLSRNSSKRSLKEPSRFTPAPPPSVPVTASPPPSPPTAVPTPYSPTPTTPVPATGSPRPGASPATEGSSSGFTSSQSRKILAGFGALLAVLVLILSIVLSCQSRTSCRLWSWSEWKTKVASIGPGEVFGACFGIVGFMAFSLVVILVAQSFLGGPSKPPKGENKGEMAPPPSTSAPATKSPAAVAPMTDAPAPCSPPSDGSPAEDDSSSGFTSFKARIILAGIAAAVLFVVLLLSCWRLRAGSWIQLKAILAVRKTHHFHAETVGMEETAHPADINGGADWGKEEELLETQQRTSLNTSEDIDLDWL